MNKDLCNKKHMKGLISEIAFFASLYYAQILLNVKGNLWITSLILWILINISIMHCPVLHNCNNKK